MSWAHFVTLLFDDAMQCLNIWCLLSRVPSNIQESLPHTNFELCAFCASNCPVEKCCWTSWLDGTAPRALLATSHSLRRRTHPPAPNTAHIQCCAPRFCTRSVHYSTTCKLHHGGFCSVCTIPGHGVQHAICTSFFWCSVQYGLDTDQQVWTLVVPAPLLLLTLLPLLNHLDICLCLIFANMLPTSSYLSPFSPPIVPDFLCYLPLSSLLPFSVLISLNTPPTEKPTNIQANIFANGKPLLVAL